MTSVNEERVPVRQWQALYRTGAFYTSEYSAMEKAGWYNWNCSSESLAERLKNLANVVMGVTHPFILDHYFILCRNLSSRFGKLYDEVGFVPLVEEEQRKCFWITPTTAKNGHFLQGGMAMMHRSLIVEISRHCFNTSIESPLN